MKKYLGQRSSHSLSANYTNHFTTNFGLQKEWHRGKLPHRNKESLLQFVTFRLADSLPKEVLAELEEKVKQLPEKQSQIELRILRERYLNKGLGSCALQHPEMAEVMMKALQHHDGVKYDLIAWSIMSNHVHVLIKTNDSISKILQSWKSFTGKWALKNNTKYNLGISPKADKFWMPEYWDRFIRDEKHFNNTVRYILDNPRAAGLSGDSVAAFYTGCVIVD